MKKIKILNSLILFFLSFQILQAQTNDPELPNQTYIQKHGINSLWNYTTGSPNSSHWNNFSWNSNRSPRHC